MIRGVYVCMQVTGVMAKLTETSELTAEHLDLMWAVTEKVCGVAQQLRSWPHPCTAAMSYTAMPKHTTQWRLSAHWYSQISQCSHAIHRTTGEECRHTDSVV
jgi:hypothetical protein